AYHMPTLGSVLRSMWERGYSFIKKAGSVILLATILIWFLSYFGVVDGTFRMLEEEEMDFSLLAAIGNAFAWLFAPLGWGTWKPAVATVTGLIAKENVVGTFGILYHTPVETEAGEEIWSLLAQDYTALQAYSFLAFNLLCAPCFAAIGAIKREMNNAKWTWFAIGWECGFAYVMSLIIYRIGAIFTGEASFGVWTVLAIACIALMVWALFRPYKEADKLTVK
ncbi:MAG: ferrous iron transporter B, partial [Erysipelotrichales bacterium]|nr:ferrous iron transporter B [Erysipelotrichales bacterium]